MVGDSPRFKGSETSPYIETRGGDVTAPPAITTALSISIPVLVFLPVLTSRVRIIKAKEDEALVMVVPSRNASGSRIATTGGSRVGEAVRLYEPD